MKQDLVKHSLFKQMRKLLNFPTDLTLNNIKGIMASNFSHVVNMRGTVQKNVFNDNFIENNKSCKL